MRFEKVTYNQYRKDNDELNCFEEFQDIKLPLRGSKFSAGHDFFAPFYFELEVGESIIIPTGIKVKLDEDKFLLCVPRSSYGFGFRIQLDNTIAIIDSDFFNNIKDEGHIRLKLTNDGKENKKIIVKQGDAFCQGIILQYYLTENDNVTNIRNGGIGSTSKN